MRLTRYTDLALRAVMRLAVVDGEELLTTRQIADSMNVPYTHMAKAIAQLQHLGVIEARRGRNGGLTLTGAGRSTRVGDLVRTLEGTGKPWSARATPHVRSQAPVDCDGHCDRHRRRSTPR